ncbi:hypothetical protein REPUB_Repub10bG0115200 [Reevesia pubescens]
MALNLVPQHEDVVDEIYLQVKPPKAAGSLDQDRWMKAKVPSAVENGTSNKAQLDEVISNATLKSVSSEHNSSMDSKNGISDESKKLATAVLSAVKAAVAATAAASNKGKIEEYVY